MNGCIIGFYELSQQDSKMISHNLEYLQPQK